MGGGRCERHGEEEGKNNKSNSVRDIQMLREIERDRGVHGAWKTQDNKSNTEATVRLGEVERDRGVHRTWKSKDNKKMWDPDVRR